VRTLSVFLISTLLLTLGLSGVVHAAQDEPVRLGIEPVDSDLHYFNISLEPGESTELAVRFSNHGERATVAQVFPADVFTLHGGGMGMADIDDPRTGATEWIGLEPAELELEPGGSVEQAFSVSVPEDTPPGDYISSLVIQNAEPVEIGDEEGTQFDQTVRQGIAVAIDVPGDRIPAFEITGISHDVTGERSVVEVDVENIGNTHLRPRGTFEFKNAEGDVLADSSVWLDTVYAGTATVLEVNFTTVLPPGEYLISMSLEDEEAGASSAVDGLELSIASPEPESEPEEGDDSEDGGLAGGLRSTDLPDSMPSPLTLIVVGSMVLLSALIILAAVLYARSRRPRRQRQPMRMPSRRPEMLRHEQYGRSSHSAAGSQPGSRSSIRQLKPPGRSG
jgi:hypothetical protein